MKIIYIVIGEFSSWDLYNERNLKAFEGKDKAEEYVIKVSRILGEVNKHTSKIWELEEQNKEESEEYKLAEKIFYTHDRITEFNKCRIEELELNNHIQK